ncbi:MAG: TAXI family TRAP transporter solute-binding subunit [Deltaproteobacteria bacterium]|nr:TAXI family TRAP transporter solute-binding subunit [Deltaproteobacteria bacterium]
MKKHVLVIAALLTFLVASPFSVSMAAQELHLGTSTVGGIYYNLGVPISQVLNKYIPGIHVTPEITLGTVENLRLMGQGKMELGITLSFMAVQASKGIGTFKEKVPNRTVMHLSPLVNFFMALESSGIKTHNDLKGKRVNLGQPGGLDRNSKNLLAAHGMTDRDIKPSVQGIGAGVDALKDGKFDAVIVTVPLANQLLATHKATIIWPEEAALDKMVKATPGYGKWLMPAGTVKGVDQARYVPDFGVTLSVVEKMDADLVYKMTKALVEHLDELKAMFSEYRHVTKEWAANDMGVPHHPGAAKYYKEAGLLK